MRTLGSLYLLLFILWSSIGCGSKAQNLSAKDWLSTAFNNDLQPNAVYRSEDLHKALRGWVLYSINNHEDAYQTWVELEVKQSKSKTTNHTLNQEKILSKSLAILGILTLDFNKSIQNSRQSIELNLTRLRLLSQESSPWIAVLGWSLSQAWLATAELKTLQDELKSISHQFLIKWAGVPNKSEPIKCSSNTIEPDSFNQKYKCILPCRTNSPNTILMIRNPWSITSARLKNVNHEVSTLLTPPKRGRSWLIKNRVWQCPNGQPNQKILFKSKYLELTLNASRRPELSWGVRPPKPPAKLLSTLPNSLSSVWTSWAEQSLLLTPYPTLMSNQLALKTQAFTTLTWSQLSLYWKTDNHLTSHSENPIHTCLKGSLNPNQPTTKLRPTLPASHQVQSSKNKANRPYLLDRLRTCITLGFHLPKAWWSLSIFERIELEKIKPNQSTFSEDIAWGLADLLIANGAPKASVLKPLININPTSSFALKWLRAYPEWMPKADIKANPSPRATQLIKAFNQKPWPPLLEGAFGQLLDLQSLFYTSSGTGIRWVSEVIRVNTRKGVEELGELQLPTDAQLIELYQLKSNGGRRAPLQILETEGYSFSDLQVGDWLVAQYFEPIKSDRRDGSVLTPKLQLKEIDRATWKKQVRIHLPSHIQSKTAMTSSLSSHLPKQSELFPAHLTINVQDGPGYELLLEANKVKRKQSEVASLYEARHSPYLQVGETYQPNLEKREAATFIQKRLFEIPNLCLSVQKLDPKLDLNSPQKIAEWVWWRIQREQAIFDSPTVDRSLISGKGNRALILSAILSACGYQNEIYLSQLNTQAFDPSLGKLDDFDHILLKLGELWVDPSLPSIPLGLVHPQYAGGVITKVWPWHPQASLVIQRVPYYTMIKPTLDNEIIEHSPVTYTLSGSLEREKNAPKGVLGTVAIAGPMTHQFYGADAAILQYKMNKAGKEALRSWVERQWSRWLGRSEVRKLSFVYENQSILLRYHLRVWVRDQQKFALNPQEWGTRFAALEKRTSPLLLPPIHQVVQLNLKGVTVAPQSAFNLSLNLPQNKSTTTSYPLLSSAFPPMIKANAKLSVHRQASSSSTAQFETQINGEWRLSGGVISSKNYSVWREFAQGVDHNEQLVIHVK